jgi:hypothetical protein
MREMSWRFVCFSDSMDALDYVRRLPVPGLKGWHNKLALFKPGVFTDDERILYLDLDTVITGSLWEIAGYKGELAVLEDVLHGGHHVGSGVMAWRGGQCAKIWASYAAAGYPDVDGGDQLWIEREMGSSADRLQDLYPNQIASYKVSDGVLAPQTRLVCFHGQPRPHDINRGWVPAFWRA